MDKDPMEEDVNRIDVIDPIDDSDPVIIYEETENSFNPTPIPCDSLKTGNILKQVFNLIANFREKDYWELSDKEVKSLNNTCPKIIPKVISEHSGIISCVLNIIGIIMKRLKLEKKDNDVVSDVEPDVVNKDEEEIGLMGGRTE